MKTWLPHRVAYLGMAALLVPVVAVHVAYASDAIEATRSEALMLLPATFLVLREAGASATVLLVSTSAAFLLSFRYGFWAKREVVACVAVAEGVLLAAYCSYTLVLLSHLLLDMPKEVLRLSPLIGP